MKYSSWLHPTEIIDTKNHENKITKIFTELPFIKYETIKITMFIVVDYTIDAACGKILTTFLQTCLILEYYIYVAAKKAQSTSTNRTTSIIN